MCYSWSPLNLDRKNCKRNIKNEFINFFFLVVSKDPVSRPESLHMKNYISFDNRTTCSLFHFVAPSGMFVYISIMRSCNSSPSIVYVSCFMDFSTLFHNLACFFLNPFGCLKLSLAQLYRSILVAAFMSSHSNNAHNGFTTQRIGSSISVVRPNVTFLFPFDLFKMKKRCRNSVVGDRFRNSFMKKVSIHCLG